MTKTRTHTFTAKVSAATHNNLNTFLDQQQQLFNSALQERKAMYEECGWSPSFQDQCKWITALRKNNPEYERFMAIAQRTALVRVDKACKAFFRRVKAGEKPGYPRFKPKGRVRSFEMPNPTIKRSGKFHSVFVKGIGRFRFKGELPEGTYKQLRVVKTPKRIKLQFVVESEVVPVADDRPPIGIDVGVKSRVSLSNGHQEPKAIIDRREIKRKQRKVSRAKPGSNSRTKKVAALAREWQAVTEHELGNLHELTARLIKHHGNKFYVEDIKPGQMTRKGKGKHGLNRAILEQQWHKFIQLLTYKAESARGWVRKVNPRNTSQWCSACGALPTIKLSLKDRDYRCERCGHEMDRDWTAANNILRIGLRDHPSGGMPGAREGMSLSHPTGKGSSTPSAQNGCIGS